MQRIFCALAIAALATPVFGQSYPFGSGTAGAGGFEPLHTANGPFIGNAGFQMRLDKAKGGSVAYFLVSTSEANIPFAGGTVYTSLISPNPFLFIPIALAGTNAGEGATSLALPIPNLASIVGFRIFSQVIVDESAGSASPIALSNGVMHVLSWGPEVFVGCSIAGGVDPYQVIDPSAFSIIDSGGNNCSDNVTSALYTHGGNQLFTGSSIQSAVCAAPSATHPISFSNIYSSSGSGCYGLGYHPILDLVWTLTDPGTGTRELTALDGNPANVSFGAPIHNTVNVAGGSNYAEIWRMSDSGNLAAVTTFFPNSLIIVDTNPQSVNFLQVLHQSSVPPSPGSAFQLVTDVAISPDEEFAVMTIQNAQAPSEVARFHIPTLTWVDHDPSTPFSIDNIGPFSVPAVSLGDAPTWIDFSSNGAFCLVGGFGNCGWTGRFDFDLADADFYAFTMFQIGGGFPNSWGGSLAPDDGRFAIGSWDANGCSGDSIGPSINFFDSGTGAFQGAVTIPKNSNSSTLQNLYTVVWR